MRATRSGSRPASAGCCSWGPTSSTIGSRWRTCSAGSFRSWRRSTRGCSCVGGVSASFKGRALGEGQGRVRAVPEQADLTPYLWGADIGLNPITTGAGSNVKLPTYLAAGLDVVSTSFGVRGFDGLKPHVKIAALDAFVDALRAPIPVDSRPGAGARRVRVAGPGGSPSCGL